MSYKYIVIFILLISAACVPQTRYRREALVPTPQAPPYRGETLGRKDIELQAQVSGSRVEEVIPNVNGPALWIPDFMINASGMFGVVDFLDLGLLISYAHGSWANKSATGTPPMPDGGKDLFAIGPQMGVGSKFRGGSLFLGGYVSLQYIRMPWSEWEADDPADWRYDCYRLNKEGVDSDLYYRLGVFFGGRPARWVALHGGLLLHASWKNIGFSNEEYLGSTLTQETPTIMPLVGARFDVDTIFFEAAITFPISTTEDIHFTPPILPLGWSISMGVKI